MNKNRKKHRKVAIVAMTTLIAASTLLGACGNAQSCVLHTEMSSQKQTAEKNTSNSDNNLKDDFYATVNASVLKEHDPEKTGGWNWFYDLEDKGYQDQKGILEAASKNLSSLNPTSAEYKLGKMYLLGMDTANRDKDGLAYFKELLHPLMSVGSIQELLQESAKLQKSYGMDGLLNAEVYAPDEKPAELIVRLKDLNYGVDAEELTAEDASEENAYYFNTYLGRLLEIAGTPKEQAKKVTTQMMDFLKDVAKNQEDGQYQEMKVSELEHILSNADLNVYVKTLLKNVPETISVKQIKALEKLNSYLTDEHLDVLKNYIYAINLEKFAPYLTTDTVNAKQEMEENYIGDAEKQDTEKSVVDQVTSVLQWETGKLYTEKNFDSEKEKAVMKIVNRLLNEYKQMLSEEEWLSEETKQKAVEKLEKMNIRIGAPKDIDTYLTNFQVDETKGYFYNIMQFKKEQSQKLYDSFGEKVDRSRWNVLPQELVPCYYPTDNSINIPVIVLDTPYFDQTSDLEQNLGAIGTIIGHEITHAFDDLGSKYDANGDLVNWWKEEDQKAFDQKKTAIVTYYDEYRTPDTMQQDGTQTLGENIADLGAMKALSRIVKEDHLNAKKFFESYANIWASTANDLSEAITSGMDEHAADKVRVNAVLSSTELFYDTYGISEKDGMYIAPEKRVGLW